MKFKKDNRSRLWQQMELQIQKKAKKKDKNFVLSGKWKKFLRKQDGFLVYTVDSEWVRNNLSVTFGHAGHGYVHEFIPLNEIWIDMVWTDSCGFDMCERKENKKYKKVSKEFLDSTILHEIIEFKEMKKGKIYWKAHQIALEAERKLGLLKNPLKDDIENRKLI